jgi:site-specific DNA-methyltransferase (cytosine-N4-specific)
MPTALPRTTIESVGSVDWDFAQNDGKDVLHNLHPYPAKFISEIPRTLIQMFPPVTGTAILDPFCGCGTTLLEGQRAGYKTIGVDLNPIACLITRVKTTALPKDFLAEAEECIAAALADRDKSIPEISNLNHWFCSGARLGIARLMRAFSRIERESLLDHLRLALSSIIVRVSNQDSDTRYAAIVKNISVQEVCAQFGSACKRIAKAKLGQPVHLPKSTVIEKDILTVKPSNIGAKVGLVVTSPPYPNAYEYWLYHKYRMWWLGFDALEVKRQEIGARAHYFKKNHPTEDDFRGQMTAVLELTSATVVPGGHIAFVIGRSRIHGKDVDNAQLLKDCADNVGLKLVMEVERIIHPSRKAFNLSHARIKNESVLVFGRP